NNRRSGAQGGDEFCRHRRGGNPRRKGRRDRRKLPLHTFPKILPPPPLAGTPDPHPKRAPPPPPLPPRFFPERAKAIGRAGRGSAHERTSNESHRSGGATGRRIHPVPREDLGGREQRILRRQNARRTG